MNDGSSDASRSLLLGVTVIVPAHNAEATLPACLAALARMSYPVREIIVFVDGSSDATAAIAEAAGARVIRNTGAPRGPAHGRNVAAREARSQLLLFVDADVVIGEDCLTILVRELCESGAAAAFGSYDDHPAATRLAGLYANLRHHFVHQNSAREASTFWSGIGLIERDVYLEFGGYDEDRFAHPSIEDVELGMRLKNAGHRIRLAPEAQGQHRKDWTLRRVWHTDVVRRALPWSRLLVEGRAEGADLNLSQAERLKALVAAATFVALFVALVDWRVLLAAAALFALYLFLNRAFISVLARKLGPARAFGGALLHLCYHVYSLGAYLWVVAAHTLRTAFARTAPSEDAPPAVGFDARFLVCLVLLTALFAWPLFLHGKPAYFDDTAQYLTGGERIFDRLFAMLGGREPGEVSAAASQGRAFGIRSLTYYALTYALSAPARSMFLLALFQALVGAFYVAAHARLAGLRAPWVLALGAALAAATPVALVAAFTVPDIFAVPILGAIVLLALSFSRFTPAMRIALVLVAALGVSTHVSYPPIALVMTGLVLMWLWWTHRGSLVRALPAALLAGLPLVAGVSVSLAGGLVGLGEVSVAPKRLPLVLARSMSDGPGRWYLRESCERERYAICELWPEGDFPGKLGPILFEDGGIMRSASSEQLDRIRAEEGEIVLAATRAYPLFQVKKSLTSIGKQFVTFRPSEIRFDRRFYRDAEGDLRTTRPAGPQSAVVSAVGTVSYVTVALSALLLVLALPMMTRERRAIVLLLFLGIAANMAICATFSAVAARYAMRVVWLVPLLAALYVPAPAAAAWRRWRGAAHAERDAASAAGHART